MTDDLLPEFEEAFSAMRKELGFKATLDELDPIFFLRDQAVQQGAVAPRLDRWTCHRIAETFWSWNHFLHRLVMPNPGSMFETTESGDFDSERQPEVIDLMTKIMAFLSRNTLLGVTQDIGGQASFIDDALTLWLDVRPRFEHYTRQVADNWDRRATNPSPQ